MRGFLLIGTLLVACGQSKWPQEMHDTAMRACLVKMTAMLAAGANALPAAVSAHIAKDHCDCYVGRLERTMTPDEVNKAEAIMIGRMTGSGNALAFMQSLGGNTEATKKLAEMVPKELRDADEACATETLKKKDEYAAEALR